MGKKIYYKVVNYKLQSIVTSKTLEKLNQCNAYEEIKFYDKFCIQYKINEWTYPIVPYTKLMVFDNFSEAYIFNSIEKGIIYECQVKNPSKIGFNVSLSSIYYKYPQLLKLIKNNKSYSCYRNFAPESTIFVKAVKLIKKVE